MEIAALCDSNEKMLENFSQRYGGKCYRDYRQMIDRENLDAAWICTPPEVRGEPLSALFILVG